MLRGVPGSLREIVGLSGKLVALLMRIVGKMFSEEDRYSEIGRPSVKTGGMTNKIETLSLKIEALTRNFQRAAKKMGARVKGVRSRARKFQEVRRDF